MFCLLKTISSKIVIALFFILVPSLSMAVEIVIVNNSGIVFGIGAGFAEHQTNYLTVTPSPTEVKSETYKLIEVEVNKPNAPTNKPLGFIRLTGVDSKGERIICIFDLILDDDQELTFQDRPSSSAFCEILRKSGSRPAIGINGPIPTAIKNVN